MSQKSSGISEQQIEGGHYMESDLTDSVVQNLVNHLDGAKLNKKEKNKKKGKALSNQSSNSSNN